MSSFFGKLFKNSKKRDAIDEYGGTSSVSVRRPARPEGQSTRNSLKSSMRHRHGHGGGFNFDESDNPTGAYHTGVKQPSRKGPRSAPLAFDNYSPNQSPSSSTDGTSTGNLERSFQSEFIPTRSHRRHGSSSVRAPSPTVFRLGKSHRKNRSRRYDNSDSENTHYDEEREYELTTAVKQIKRYKTNLANVIDESRKLENDKHLVERENKELRKANKQLCHDYTMLKLDYERLKTANMMDQQRMQQLTEEIASLRNYYFQTCNPMPTNRYMYPSSGMPFTSFMTPPSSIRANLDNTNTGNSRVTNPMSQNPGASGFRPPPTLGEGGSGESLAFMSGTTINSGPKAPRLIPPGSGAAGVVGGPVDDMQDEIKIFRRNENSPLRTSNGPDELLSSYNSFGSNNGPAVPPPWADPNSTESSPKGDKTLETDNKQPSNLDDSAGPSTSGIHNTTPETYSHTFTTTSNQPTATPIAPDQPSTSAPSIDARLAKFERLIITQSHSLTPQSQPIPKRHNSAEDFESVLVSKTFKTSIS
uniref:PRKG1_interact domain-containing protein n=1 Tax=Panagrellus redivivus TaxID=6233 RepID=A0A7E4VLG1_PANRE